MRIGQITALLVVFFESRLMQDMSWPETGDLTENPGGFSIIVSLVMLLVLSELVRVGRWTSTNSLEWLGHIARFTGLLWAITGFIALFIAWLVPGANNGDAPLFLLGLAGGLALATSFYAFSIGRTRIVVRRFTITQSRDTNDNSRGERTELLIAVLSDLHLGDFVSTAHIRRAVGISNNETPDVVLLVGDYVDKFGSLAAELVAELTMLEARLGVFAVLGNHDVECCDSPQLIDELERDQTISLLRNTSAFVEIKPAGEVDGGLTSKTVQIVGIESPGDEWAEESDTLGKDVLRSELLGSAVDLTIVASHHAEVIGASAELAVDLVVAGHTHGGQLALPFTGRLLSVGRLTAKYFLGLYEHGTTKLIVTAGIGVGVIPARIGVPPEVALIRVLLD